MGLDSAIKVSIIVPVYNVELYLEKCLLSLVNQTLQNIEILVMNDGSKDNSQQIIEKFQKDYPNKIFGFIKENGGLSDARNFGIDRAKGQYLGFVDSDDYVSETMFEEMYGLAEKHQAEMAICNLQKVDENGTVTQKLTQLPGFPEKITLENNLSVFSDISYFACNKLFKKELFQNKRFKRGIHFEDIELIPQLLLNCNILAFTPNYHYQYLERQNSISKSHTTKGLDILRAVETVSEKFNQSRFSDQKKDLKGFQILEGVYTFLAYQAFVKDEGDFYKMSKELDRFIALNDLKIKDILEYKRFGKNYLLSLPLRKKIYYILGLFRLRRIVRLLTN
ncbi:glycosyltransferase family 2 protein [Epilithonimonas hungarica]|uniref:Glycosyltransferase involved in cell wall bisynthesis n=1 Tax=Epilithonimonas hungarica TaxID=454006 RepID=A0A1G7G319_9FLAO|nr:glycosyltransferase family 2 protein [Epilithonimonas hungarica]SDE82532.1 Glycosyltransferase involved in cell wall bisynthesis [Epilithonimonas hungarica]